MAKAKISAVVSEDAEWRAECDMRSLMEAEKIKADPKRFKAARELAKKKMMEVASIATEKDES